MARSAKCSENGCGRGRGDLGIKGGLSKERPFEQKFE